MSPWMISRCVRFSSWKLTPAVGLELFQIVAVLPLDAPVLALGLLNPRGLGFLFQIVDLAVERAHGVDRLVYAVDQPLALGVGELQLADPAGNLHVRASQGPAELARYSLGFFFCVYRFELFLQAAGLFCSSCQCRRSCPVKSFSRALDDFVGDLFFVEGDHFFDGAHAASSGPRPAPEFR